MKRVECLDVIKRIELESRVGANCGVPLVLLKLRHKGGAMEYSASVMPCLLDEYKSAWSNLDWFPVSTGWQSSLFDCPACGEGQQR